MTPLFISLGIILSFAHCAAQNCNAAAAPEFFKPLTGGDGLRYPITIGPLSWSLMGDEIQPVKGTDGLIHVAYSLQVTNSWNRLAKLKSFTVVDPAKNDTETGANKVMTLRNQEITGQLRPLSHVATLEANNYVTELPSGQAAVMYFDVTYASDAPIPSAIAHRVVVDAIADDGKSTTFTVTSAPMRISCKPAMALSPPLRGKGWVNGNGCCKEIGPHRFVMNSINGALRPTEAFAIDWVQMGADGKMFHDDPKNAKNWYCYGADILAVGDGVVVEVVRDLPNVVAGKSPTGLSIEQIAGNRVIIDMGGGDMGEGRYAEYDHMAPGSPAVRVGDSVKKGQKIGLLGNTGNSDAPHLHFQIMDHPSSLDGSALPFVFDHMMLEGRIPLDLQTLDDMSQRGTAISMDKRDAKAVQEEMPLSLDVLEFK